MRVKRRNPLLPTKRNTPSEPSTPLSPEAQLRNDIASFSKDPYGFVLYAFPWKTGELDKHQGPDDWQIQILKAIRDGLLTIEEAIQVAVASGHGIGKSALISWLILWGLSTFEDTRGIVTANTETQLKTKTWPELAKWYRLFIAKHWFEYTATSMYSKQKEHEKTWRVDMIAWSENNTEAFAGLHNQGKRVLLFFDEASAISDKIWEVAEGALTDKDTELLWIAFGNPTRNSGRFHACFHGLKHRWNTQQIDSRTARMSNKERIKKWEQDYGEDSDWFKVRVRGEFPNASEMQFIPNDYVEKARGRHLLETSYNFAAVVIGVDPAWTGGDETCIFLRQGLMSKMLACLRTNNNDVHIAQLVARYEDEYKADGVAIDLGYGTGIYSAGQVMGRTWTLVPFGGSSPDEGYMNMRAHMWNQMKMWLRDGGSIPNDPVLAEELVSPEAYTAQTGRSIGKVYLESKDDIKDRGLSSPNRADALALTFSINVLPRTQFGIPLGLRDSAQVKHEWDPFADDRT